MTELSEQRPSNSQRGLATPSSKLRIPSGTIPKKGVHRGRSPFFVGLDLLGEGLERRLPSIGHELKEDRLGRRHARAGGRHALTEGEPMKVSTRRYF